MLGGNLRARGTLLFDSFKLVNSSISLFLPISCIKFSMFIFGYKSYFCMFVAKNTIIDYTRTTANSQKNPPWPPYKGESKSCRGQPTANSQNSYLCRRKKSSGMEQKNKVKEQIIAYLLLIVGSFLFAVGDVMFVNPYLLAPGGTYGLSNVLNTVFPWKISYYAICMDIPLLLIGTWILGPKFGVKTVISTILIFAFTWVLETFWGYNPVIHEGIVDAANQLPNMVQIPHSESFFIPDYFLNTVVAGIIYGIAIGLIFKSGATSGGSDIISMIIHKYTKISLGKLVMIVDSIITFTTLIAFKQIRLPIYSIILIFIEGKVIDLIVEGMKTYKTVYIVTDNVEAMRNYILNELHRGGTLFLGQGLYAGTERSMIYVSLERADLVKLKNNLRHIDPTAFVNIIDSAEIMGQGFKALPTE